VGYVNKVFPIPEALIVVEISDLIGYNLWGVYPKDFDVPRSILGSIMTAHVMMQKSEVIIIPHDDYLSLSYSTGKNGRDLIILLLNREEAFDIFKDGFEQVAKQILSNLDVKNLDLILPHLFHALCE